jgi:hypothetical protein
MKPLAGDAGRSALFLLEARVVSGDALVPRVGSLGLAFPLGWRGPNYHPSREGCGGANADGMSVEVR